MLGLALPPLTATFLVRNLAGGGTGKFTVEVHPDWSPEGAARFGELINAHFFNGCRFFRVVSGFVAQFGIPGDPALAEKWRLRPIPDDPVVVSNTRGRLTFAASAPKTRATQIFLNLGNNSFLDNQGYPPFGEVIEGLDVADRLFSGYGESSPRGRGPDQLELLRSGSEYLHAEFPLLSYIDRVEANISSAELSRFVASPAETHDFGLMFAIMFCVLLVSLALGCWATSFCCFRTAFSPETQAELPAKRYEREAVHNDEELSRLSNSDNSGDQLLSPTIGTSYLR
ncbi:unnamed protein product [Polarella glacialis]|uniref:Peptidyl-prolyl cis-trans isomerase n=1 Tax=Polarella glacialis TaxID=89957 RepID=A0A813LKF1_POLGL|nr:unnamed protein product [Polarella glacialis]